VAGDTSARAPLIAYLIAAHTEPALLGRLVRALATPWSRFFVHIDAKVPIAPFVEQLAGLANVSLIEDRVQVNWGGFSQVEATLRMLRAARTSGEAIARYTLLSGACYPVVGNFVLREILCNGALEYVQSHPMPGLTKPLTRLTRWHFEGGQRRTGIQAIAIRALNSVMDHGPRRDLARGLGNLEPHAGGNWWALSDPAVRTVLDTVDARPRMVRFFRHADCPDECFFQTILSNSVHAPQISQSVTFADWTVKGRGPRLIDERHLDWLLDGDTPPAGIVNQPYLFARKFTAANAHLLDRIDLFRRAQDTTTIRAALIAEAMLAWKTAVS
jgi:hypothetical protein